MLWFRHEGTLRTTAMMRKIRLGGGSEAVAAAYQLMEIICQSGEANGVFTGAIALEDDGDLGWLANELDVNRDKVDELLRLFVRCKLVNGVALQKKMLFMPILLREQDIYARRRAAKAKKKSGEVSGEGNKNGRVPEYGSKT